MTTIVLLLVVVDSDLLSSMAIRNSNYIKYGYMIGLLVYEYCSIMIIEFLAQRTIVTSYEGYSSIVYTKRGLNIKFASEDIHNCRDRIQT